MCFLSHQAMKYDFCEFVCLLKCGSGEHIKHILKFAQKPRFPQPRFKHTAEAWFQCRCANAIFDGSAATSRSGQVLRAHARLVPESLKKKPHYSSSYGCPFKNSLFCKIKGMDVKNNQYEVITWINSVPPPLKCTHLVNQIVVYPMPHW